MELVWLILTTLCIKDVYNFQLEEADTKSNVLAVDYPDTDFLNGWFKQPLDHFNPLDTRKWNQRYTVYDKFGTKSKNVAFLFIGWQMEYAIDPMKTIAWMDYAEHFSATCFYLIHRYYGESHPTEDLSLDNLQYLTSHQAIADAVNFINVMNKQYKLSPDVKWIVFGDEYAGALATWLRMSYSHLVHGAVSSSGILEAKLNFKESHQVLYDILRSYSDACPVALKNAFSQIEFLQGSDKGHKILTKLFHLGIPFEEIVKDTNNIDYFYFVLSSYFHNYLLNRHWKVNLSIFCDKMTNEALGIEIERLVAIIELILQLTKKTNLIINYNDWIENEKDTRWNVAAEYHKALYDILRSHSDACLVAVKNAFNLITFLLKTDSGRAILDDLLHPDIPFESIVRETYNIDYFYYVLSSLFHENILNRYWKTNLNIWCTILTNETIGIELLRLAEINDLMLENREATTLSINYTQWMDWNKITRWNTTQARAWSYQQCTEFGLFSTSDYKPQIFGNKYPLDFFITKCQRMFDPRFDKFFISNRVDKTNFIDGRWNIRVSNVVFVYGSMDIWRPLGIKNTVKDSSIIVINGAINSEVSDKLAQNDSPEMEFAREKIHGLIGQWLIS